MSPLPASHPDRTGPRGTAAGLDPAQRPGPLPVEPPLGRGNVERSPVPGHDPGGSGTDRFAERTAQIPLNAAILVVATVVVGQLWALTVALDTWLAGEEGPLAWLIAFQLLSFAISLGVWFATPRGGR